MHIQEASKYIRFFWGQVMEIIIGCTYALPRIIQNRNKSNPKFQVHPLPPQQLNSKERINQNKGRHQVIDTREREREKGN